MWEWLKRLQPQRTFPTRQYDDLISMLIVQDDRATRSAIGTQLRDVLARELDASADRAQIAVWTLSHELREQFGATNEMVSEALAHARAAHQGADRLRDDLLSLEQRHSDRLHELHREIGDLRERQAAVEARR